MDCAKTAAKSSEDFILTEPKSEADWKSYFDLRWRVLRAPWNQPRGSERDDQEDESIHLMVCDRDHRALAVGRLHFRSPAEAQVRYMAVDEAFAGRGLGGKVLEELERRAAVGGREADRVECAEECGAVLSQAWVCGDGAGGHALRRDRAFSDGERDRDDIGRALIAVICSLIAYSH